MPTHPAAAEGDVFQLACLDVAVERFDRAAEPGGGLRGSLESVRRGLARLALLASYRSPASCFYNEEFVTGESSWGSSYAKRTNPIRSTRGTIGTARPSPAPNALWAGKPCRTCKQ
jgi:hypothetical protein